MRGGQHALHKAEPLTMGSAQDIPGVDGGAGETFA
jgi:hypothetical protein